MSVPEKKTNDTETVNISAELFRELIAEMRKPPAKTEEQIRDEQQKIADRKALGEQVKAAEAARIANQEACTHMRKDGSTTATYVTSLGFMYCQACGAVIRVDEKPELFNRLFQLTQ